MSYEVFARKYRPQTFADVVGQEHITRTLRNAIEQNRLAHAYIFVGPRGTGKTSTARILAKSLNCESAPGPTITPCGKCDSCREIAAGNSLDVLEFDAASNTQVDKVREIIIDNVKYAPSRGRYKVYIVDEVHMLSVSSFNALLKTLEEPPSHVKFIFATTDVQKVPTTIISRCQRFDLKRIPTGLIAQHLLKIAANEQINLTDDAADAIARAAEGGMRDAESMLDQLVAFCGQEIAEADVLSVFGLTSRQTVSDLCATILASDVSGALAVVHEQAEAGRDLSRLMADLIVHLRNVLIAQADPGTLAEDMSPEAVEALSSQAEQVRMEKLLELIEQLAAAEGRMRWSPNRKMHFEVALIRATQIVGQASLSEVLETLDSIRRGEPVELGRKPTARPPAAPPKKIARAAAPAPAPVAKPAPQALEEPKAPAIERPAPTPAPASPAPAATAPAPAPTPAPPAPVPEAKVPRPIAPEPEPTPVVNDDEETSPFREEEAAAPVAAVAVDSSEVWEKVIAGVAAKRPLAENWVRSGTYRGVEGKQAVVAFPAELSAAADMLQTPINRQLIESLLSEALGQEVTFKTRIEEGLAAPAPKPPEPARDPMEDFRDDPLIRKALDIFKAEIQTA